MERPELETADSGSSDEYLHQIVSPGHETRFTDHTVSSIQLTPTSTISTNLSQALSAVASNQATWNSPAQPRQRMGSAAAIYDGPSSAAPVAAPSPRPQRPTAPIRTVSSTYNPPRKPPQFIQLNPHRQRSYSTSRSRRDPNAQYRAQEKAYIQQLRQNPRQSI